MEMDIFPLNCKSHLAVQKPNIGFVFVKIDFALSAEFAF